MSDSLANGRTLRVLTVVDDLTRVSQTMAVAHSITGERLAQLLDQVAARHGCPRTIVVDNGPEFTSRALDQWAYERGIELHFIERESRCRTRTSRGSTAACATSAWTRSDS